MKQTIRSCKSRDASAPLHIIEFQLRKHSEQTNKSTPLTRGTSVVVENFIRYKISVVFDF